jgi:hypothetical protein
MHWIIYLLCDECIVCIVHLCLILLYIFSNDHTEILIFSLYIFFYVSFSLYRQHMDWLTSQTVRLAGPKPTKINQIWKLSFDRLAGRFYLFSGKLGNRPALVLLAQMVSETLPSARQKKTDRTKYIQVYNCESFLMSHWGGKYAFLKFN